MAGFDMNELLSQAMAMQEQLQRAQAEAAERRYTGAAGGGLVSATVSGAGELVELVIKPEACDPDEADTLADLVVAAVRTAKAEADRDTLAEMPALPDLGSLGL